MALSLDDYRKQVQEDLLDYVHDAWGYDSNVTVDDILEQAFVADSVTGNGSGSYTFSAYEAQENLSEVICDDEVIEMFRDAGYEGIPLDKGAEAIDVILRCFLINDFESDVEELLNKLNLP